MLIIWRSWWMFAGRWERGSERARRVSALGFFGGELLWPPSEKQVPRRSLRALRVCERSE